MSRKPKRPITFYAEPEVQEWYDSLEYGEGSRLFNEFAKTHLHIAEKRPDKIIEIEQRLNRLERLVFKLLEKLKYKDLA